MKLSVFAILFGIALGSGPYGALNMAESWKEEIAAYDWENLDHKLAFDNWKNYFGKSYDTLAEEAKRFMIFLENWRLIQEHNVAGKESYTMRINQFSDLTGEEFKIYVHGHDGSCIKTRPAFERAKIVTESFVDPNAPTSIDWTNVNGESYVTPVKNQGQCGSCWAFSTTGSIESQTAIANKQTGSAITTLSEQQLVDCSGSYGNNGCNGGLMDNAFKYVKAEGGLCSEKEYPYTARNGACKASTCGTKYDPITGYKDVTSDNMNALVTAVGAGPTSIAIEADQTAFQHYSSGIITGTCGTRLDHGVLAVGYGSSGSQQYWKVKNSWGTSWGQQGYCMICKDCGKNGNKGECGILMEPSYPTV